MVKQKGIGKKRAPQLIYFRFTFSGMPEYTMRVLGVTLILLLKQ